MKGLDKDSERFIAAALRNGAAVSTGVNLAALLGGGEGAVKPHPDLPVPTKDEAGFQQQVITVAHWHGWAVAHFRTVRVQRADGSVYYATPAAADGEGFTDLLLARDRIVYAELKSEKGVLGVRQKWWRDRLLKAGAEWHLWRPSHWPEIKEVLK